MLSFTLKVNKNKYSTFKTQFNKYIHEKKQVSCTAFGSNETVSVV